MVQAAGAPGLQEKVTFDMQLTDLVADLRAEITAWWESKASNFTKETKLDGGPLRLISQGQEISADTDEKSLSELGFKDMQLVFVSLGARSGAFMKNSSEIPPFPGKEKMPMNLLLKPVHFEQLFKKKRMSLEVSGWLRDPKEMTSLKGGGRKVTFFVIFIPFSI